ncbi:TetR/AcrR family transcriptional regulator [Tomitella biformata]|uniref:TetR/AcrR family transcriptional regulator n=1 Tax=Tomitella biformata TaxID=630403 RepID=UPI0004AE1038|nr:TetR/AcrR family transcriptional regulator [Tomitella biformata]
MSREPSSTREKLLAAGAELFARDGIDGALTRAIVTAAGQSNDSAINYHFGSRHGLLTAILDEHMAAIESRQPEGPLPADIPGLIRIITTPVSRELESPAGRNFLRIIVQLSGQSGVTTRQMPNPLRGSSVGGQLAALDDALRTVLPEEVALERLAMLVSMLTAVLADRGRRLDGGQPILLDHDLFVANTVAMLTAAMLAPHAVGQPASPPVEN